MSEDNKNLEDKAETLKQQAEDTVENTKEQIEDTTSKAKDKLEEFTEKAEEKFKQALDFSPDHPLVLNYLGYTWLDQGKKIDLAMIMIKKAVEQRPNDGYIVDSLGWAYYQIGDYSNAVENLEKAVELIPGDSIITDHLGDALFHVGRKIEAKFQWQRALEFSPPEDLIIKINNKIKGLETPKPGVKAPSSKNM
mgnify:CR=1 FL=1